MKLSSRLLHLISIHEPLIEEIQENIYEMKGLKDSTRCVQERLLIENNIIFLRQLLAFQIEEYDGK